MVRQRIARGVDREERVTWDDYLMIILAIVSLAILIVESAFAYTLDAESQRALVRADLAIVAVFAVEYLLRLLRAPRKLNFVLSNWYDLLGMIPVSHPMLRGFRLFRLLRIVVLTSRFVRATNRTFGEMTVEAVARRYHEVIVQAIGDRLLIRSLDVLEGPLGRSHLPATLGASLSEQKEELRKMIRKSLEHVPVVRRLVRLPYSDEILLAMESVSLEVVTGILQSDEINETVQNTMLSSLDELRRAVRQKEEEEEQAQAERKEQAQAQEERKEGKDRSREEH